VRDVVDLHVRAMLDPAARGERFLCVAGETVSLMDVARILRSRLPDASKKVPRIEIPDWLVKLLARVVPQVRPAVPHLGIVRATSNEKARRVLGWSPRSNEEAIVSSAESLIRLRLAGK
jgi:dihydroflavonol-4-reductase